MSLSLTILIIAISLIPLKIALFEGTFAVILALPVLAFLIGKYSSLNFTAYIISTAIIYAILYATLFPGRKNRSNNLKSEFFPIVCFILAFHFFYSLTQKWPDFIAIGERLRDFGILSSVIQSPIDLKEPWMAGWPLNYYAFWYRFGHMLSTIFSLKTWEVYNVLQCFTYALYFATSLRFLNKYLEVNKVFSFFFAVLICLGSNLAGIKDFVFAEAGWWGPSRVIPGAINEFPVWSFLLGDLHPHYLNLPLLPFFAVFYSYLILSVKNPVYNILIFISAFILSPLWIANANIWDLPAWLLFAGIFTLYYLINFFKNTYIIKTDENKIPALKIDYQFISYLLLILGLVFSLYLSRKNIVAPDYPPRFVKDPIPRTSLHDFCLHFGIPFFIITAASVLLVRDRLLKATSVILAFYFFFFSEVLPLLLALLLINSIRISETYSIFTRKKSSISFSQLLLEATGLFSLSILLVPEIIFLDDPYGADIERMNTIFKIYSVSWFFIHVYAFYHLSNLFEMVRAYCKGFRSAQSRGLAFAVALIFIALPIFTYSLGFFVVTMDERSMKNQTVQPYIQGLSEIDRLYPGSANTVKTLQSLPKGIVLEAQGKPYDYTSMISTLSEQPSFVGWVNHVNLLLSNNPEIGRREALSDEFYNSKDCEQKKSILNREGISYVVFGALEKLRHQSAVEGDFSCLKLIKADMQFSIYSRP